MAKTQLPRSGASQWSADSDLWPGRTGFNAEFSNYNTVFALWGQGTTAQRPVAAFGGRFYFATDTRRLFYDNGTSWDEVSPVGGGGTPTSVDIGTAGAEGTSRIAARADHTHALSVPAVDPGALTYGGAAARGSSGTPARADHTHALTDLPRSSTAPGAMTYGGTGAAGGSASLARADHTHTLAALPLSTAVAPGALAYGTPGDIGLSGSIARADHTHTLPSLPLANTAPGAVTENTAGSAGSSTSVARADHTHTFDRLDYGGTFTGNGDPGIPSDSNGRRIPLQTATGVQGGASITSGAVVVTYTGVYQGYVKAAFELTLPPSGTVACILEVNGVGSTLGVVADRVSQSHTTAIMVPFRRRLVAGNSIGVQCWQQTGASVSRPDVELSFDLIALG